MQEAKNPQKVNGVELKRVDGRGREERSQSVAAVTPAEDDEPKLTEKQTQEE